MATETLSQYSIIDDAEAEHVVDAATMTAALGVVETGSTVAVQATRIRKSVTVLKPDNPVRFNVTVSPDAAATAGCIALPKTFLVNEGDKVILQANIPSTAGYTFGGWYHGTVQLSPDAVAEITIQVPDTGAEAYEISAKFTAV